MRLYLPEDAAEQGAFVREETNGLTNAPDPASTTRDAGHGERSSVRPPVRDERGGRTPPVGPSATPDEDLERALASDEDWWCSLCELPLEPSFAGEPHCHGHEDPPTPHEEE
jgi:hypothetical protein